MPCAPALQRAPPRPSAGSQAKRGAAGAGRGKAGTGHKGSKSGKAGKKGMKRSASFAFGPADGEPGMRRRSVNVRALPLTCGLQGLAWEQNGGTAAASCAAQCWPLCSPLYSRLPSLVLLRNRACQQSATETSSMLEQHYLLRVSASAEPANPMQPNRGASSDIHWVRFEGRHHIMQSVSVASVILSVQEEEAAEGAAQEAVNAELHRRAASRAAWLSATRRSALDWLRSPVTEAAAEAVAEWQRILQVCLPASLCAMRMFIAR